MIPDLNLLSYLGRLAEYVAAAVGTGIAVGLVIFIGAVLYHLFVGVMETVE